MILTRCYLLAQVRYVEYANTLLREAADFFGRPTLTIWYEDFQRDPGGELRRAAEFVGSAAGGAELAAAAGATRFSKASSGRLRQDVANWQASAES